MEVLPLGELNAGDPPLVARDARLDLLANLVTRLMAERQLAASA
jgi:hypothetical protein